jgi:hypothetical protein
VTGVTGAVTLLWSAAAAGLWLLWWPAGAVVAVVAAALWLLDAAGIWFRVTDRRKRRRLATGEHELLDGGRDLRELLDWPRDRSRT